MLTTKVLAIYLKHIGMYLDIAAIYYEKENVTFFSHVF